MSVTEATHTPEPWREGIPGTVVADVRVEGGPRGANEADGVSYYGGHLIGESMTRANARRIVACVNACAGVPTDALEAGVVRELVEAADRYLRAMTRESDDDPNCWAEEEYAEEWLRNVLARVRGGGVA